MIKKLQITASLALSLGLLQVQAQELPAPVNQPGMSETSPAISFDGSAMVYAGFAAGKSYFYESKLIAKDQWGEGKPIEILNKLVDAGNIVKSPSLNYNGTKLYFSSNKAGTIGGTDIFYAVKKDGKWGEPVNIGAPINTAIDEDCPSMGSNERMVFFTRQTVEQSKDKKILQQIHYSTKDDQNKWLEPIVLPPPFNLSFETSPRISADNRTLFFVSDRKNEKGGLNVYYTKIVPPGLWMLPVALDTISEKGKNILSPAVSLQTDKIIYEKSEETKKGVQGGLFSFFLPPSFRPEQVATVSGTVTDLFTGKPLAAKIKITEASTFRTYAELENDPATGNYLAILPAGAEYKIDVYNDGYSHSYFTQDNRKGIADDKIKKDIKLYSYINLTLNVFDKEIFEPLNAKLTVTEDGSNKVIYTSAKGETPGRYKLQLPIGKSYNVSLEADNYDTYKFAFDMAKVVQFDDFERDIELVSTKKPFTVSVKDLTTGQPMQVEVSFVNINRNEKLQAITEADGSLKTALRRGNDYVINIQNIPGYAFHNEKVVITTGKEAQAVEIKLMALKKETRVALNNITFETNSSDLNESSNVELEQLAKLLLDNPNISIELSAHTDDKGADAYNNKLSDRRAQSVLNYLTERKVSVERVVARGYGKTKPLVPNTTEANRAINRRVEFKITEVK